MNKFWGVMFFFSGFWCILSVWGFGSIWEPVIQIAATLWIVVGAGGMGIKSWRGEL